ncbi:MAG: SMP-30/gluconolactonase/LRE family protein [Gammaproteobacteria bacterium]|nr:SMP-30/gluconolactonase/LRE family protein [Gammaproteobacteria bacterium]
MHSTASRGLLGTLWRAVRWLLVPAAIVAAYLFFWPTPLDPYAWTPQPNPGTAGPRFVPTQDLSGAASLASNLIANRFELARRPVNFGPEDVAVGPRDGMVYTGIGDGRILRIDPRTGASSEFANTRGRPLGLAFDATGDVLYVADARLGLLAVDTQGKVTTLVDEVDGQALGFADNLDVAPDGTVWFSAPTRQHTLEQVTLDVWDSRPTGRLLHYDPRTGRVETVLDNLFYANGVEVAKDGSFVLVAEFLAYRIQRYWITGRRAGSHEIFIDNLPGYPDNITRAPDGSFLVGLSLARLPGLDKVRPNPRAVEMVYRLPPSLTPKPQFPGYLLQLAPDGKVRRFIADETAGDVAQITAAAVLPGTDASGQLQVVAGSLLVNSVRRFPLASTRD